MGDLGHSSPSSVTLMACQLPRRGRLKMVCVLVLIGVTWILKNNDPKHRQDSTDLEKYDQAANNQEQDLVGDF